MLDKKSFSFLRAQPRASLLPQGASESFLSFRSPSIKDFAIRYYGFYLVQYERLRRLFVEQQHGGLADGTIV